MKQYSKRQIALKFFKDFLLLSLGAFIYACAVALFLTPAGTLNGGASGLAIIMNYLIPSVGTGIWIFLVNIPLLALAVWKLGPIFSIKTVISVALTSLFTEILTPLPEKFAIIGDIELLPAAILGGIFAGAGIGFAFKAGSCQGGSDIVVKVLRLKFKALKSGSLFLIIDGIVVCLGYNEWYFDITLPNGAHAQILDIMDYISNNCFMPLVAIGTCILIGWITGPGMIIEEAEKSGCKMGRKRLYVVMIRYVAPVLLVILLLKSLGILTVI